MEQVDEQIEEHKRGDDQYFKTASLFLSLCNNFFHFFDVAPFAEQVNTLKFLFSGFTLDQEKLTLELREPFNSVWDFNLKSAKRKNGRGCLSPLELFGYFNFAVLRKKFEEFLKNNEFVLTYIEKFPA